MTDNTIRSELTPKGSSSAARVQISSPAATGHHMYPAFLSMLHICLGLYFVREPSCSISVRLSASPHTARSVSTLMLGILLGESALMFTLERRIWPEAARSRRETLHVCAVVPP